MRALITGVTGQDGSYLAELLLSKGYEVYGIVRRVAGRERPADFEVIEADITDATAMAQAVARVNPDEVYNLAAMSHVGESFKSPAHTFDVDAKGALNVLDASRRVGARFYQASTSELFGTTNPPHDERSEFHPRSPYGVAKLAAHWLTINYREAYGMHASTGILFNHESPRRGGDFVTQKIVRCAARKQPVRLGNLEARRDWGHAKDYVRAMWMILQQERPSDYVVATGKTHSVADLCRIAYGMAGLDWREFVSIDPEFIRPAEVPDLRGDSTRIRAIGWEPEYSFEDTIREMYEHALSTAA